MVKRTWIVVSMLWTLLFLVVDRQDSASQIAAAIVIPWATGLAVWVCWRFIRGRRREPRPDEPTGIMRYR